MQFPDICVSCGHIGHHSPQIPTTEDLLGTPVRPEIERKWRLYGVSGSFHFGDTVINILQGYLETPDSYEIRLRCKNGSECSLGVKSSGALVRSEWETPVPVEVFDKFWRMTKDRIHKKRRIFTHNGYKLEVDFYMGSRLSGLIIIECEFISKEEAAAFQLPDWLRPHVKEVTYDLRYKNRNLACLGSLQELSM